MHSRKSWLQSTSFSNLCCPTIKIIQMHKLSNKTNSSATRLLSRLLWTPSELFLHHYQFQHLKPTTYMVKILSLIYRNLLQLPQHSYQTGKIVLSNTQSINQFSRLLLPLLYRLWFLIEDHLAWLKVLLLLHLTI